MPHMSQEVLESLLRRHAPPRMADAKTASRSPWSPPPGVSVFPPEQEQAQGQEAAPQQQPGRPVLSLRERAAIAFGAPKGQAVGMALQEARARRQEALRQRELDIKEAGGGEVDLTRQRYLQEQKDIVSGRKGAAALGRPELLREGDPFSEIVPTLENPEERKLYMEGIAGRLPARPPAPRQPPFPYQPPEELNLPPDWEYVPGVGPKRKREKKDEPVANWMTEDELSEKGWFTDAYGKLRRDYSVAPAGRLTGGAFDDLTLNGTVVDAASEALDTYQRLGNPDLGFLYAAKPGRVASPAELEAHTAILKATLRMRRYFSGAAVTESESSAAAPLILRLESGQPPNVVLASLGALLDLATEVRQRILTDADAAGFDVSGFEDEMRSGTPQNIRRAPRRSLEEGTGGATLFRDPATGLWRRRD